MDRPRGCQMTSVMVRMKMAAASSMTGNQEMGWALIQATSKLTVSTDATVETRMAREVTRASRPYIFASMKGPVPMGSALISTAVQAHNGGIENT
ncbi:hypothetical protein D3C87_1999330 [compost metagenome]